MAGARKETEIGAMSVAFLVGAFPVPYEQALRDEMAAVAGKVRARIISLYGPGSHEAAATQSEDVSYLARRNPATRLMSSMPLLLKNFLARPVSTALHPNRMLWMAKLKKELLRHRPSVLHAQFGHLGLIAAPISDELRIPVIVSFRGQDVLLVSKCSDSQRNTLSQAAELFLARSQFMRNELLTLGLPEKKVIVLPSGIPIRQISFSERTAPHHGPVRVLSAGRLVAKKGFDDAIEAVVACPDAELTIVGDGPLRGRLERLSQKHRINSVHFAGQLSRPELLQEMFRAHIFLRCELLPNLTRARIISFEKAYGNRFNVKQAFHISPSVEAHLTPSFRMAA